MKIHVFFLSLHFKVPIKNLNRSLSQYKINAKEYTANCGGYQYHFGNIAVFRFHRLGS